MSATSRHTSPRMLLPACRSAPTIARVQTPDELALLERLLAYDTPPEDGIRDAFAFLRGWLEGRSIAHREYESNGLPSLVAAVGEGPRTNVVHAHAHRVPRH